VLGYGYDAAARLTSLTYTLGQTALGSVSYAYDRTGQRTLVGGPWARATLPAAIASATYNAANHQLTLGGQTLTYDLNGNLTSLADGSGTTTYTWNARNQLTSLTAPGATATFGYDALGRRWTRTVNGIRTDWLYDGFNPVQEGVLPTTVVANLLTGLEIDEFLTRTDAAGLRALLPDALGSTLALTDATGAVQTEYTYEPFGATTPAGQASTSPHQFTGRENDGTGLYYYRARYYHPGLSRFLSEDPLEFAAGDWNLYAYVSNSPLNGTDPLGLMILPPDPSGLGPEWKHDPSHKYPHGERYRDPSGRPLDFHRPRPGFGPGTHRGNPHWHDPNNFGDRFLRPGTEVPDPAPLPPRRPPVAPVPPRGPRIWWPWPGHLPIIPMNPCALMPDLCGGSPAEAGTPNKSQQ
jgi:RHS repeat-associated protein